MFARHSLFRIENKESRLLSYREYSPNRQKVFETIGFTQERIRCLDRSAAVIEHNGCINTARWHKNGIGLLTGGDDRYVKYWNLTSDFDEVELQNAQLTRHRGNIFCVDFSAIDNNIIISAAADGSVRSSSLLNHNLGSTLRSSVDIIHMFHIDQDQPHVIYTAEEAGCIYRIDLRTANAELLFRHVSTAYTDSPAWDNEKYGNIMSTMSSSAPVKSIIQHPCFAAPHLIVGGRGYIVSLLDLRLTNHHHADDTAAVSTFSKFWSPMFPFNNRSRDSQKIAEIEQATSGSLPYAQRSEDSDYVRYIRKQNAHHLMNEVSVSGLDISKDGNRILVSFQHDQIYTFGFRTADEETCTGVTAMVGGHINYATFLKSVRFFGPHDEYVVAGCDSGNVWIWESQHCACSGITQDANDVHVCPVVNVLKADDRTCNGCIPHPYEPLLLSYGIDDTAKLWGFIGHDYHDKEQEDDESVKMQSSNAYHRCKYTGSNSAGSSSSSTQARNFQRYSLPLSGYNRCLSPYSLIYALPELLEANLVEAGITLPKVFELESSPVSRCVMNPWDFKNTANKLRWWQYYNHVLLPMRQNDNVNVSVKELFDLDEGTFMPSDELNHLLIHDIPDKGANKICHHMATIIHVADNNDNMHTTHCVILTLRMRVIHNIRVINRKEAGIDSYIFINATKLNKQREKLFHYLFLPLLEMSRLAELYKTLGNTAFKAKKYDVSHFFYCKAQRYTEYILQMRLVESQVLVGDRKLLSAVTGNGADITGARTRWQRSDPPSLQPLYNPHGDLESEDGRVRVDSGTGDQSGKMDESDIDVIDEDAFTDYKKHYDRLIPQHQIKLYLLLKHKLTQLEDFLEGRKAPAETRSTNNIAPSNSQKQEKAIKDATQDGSDNKQDKALCDTLDDEEEILGALTTEEEAWMEEVTSSAFGQRLKEFAFTIMQTMYNQYLPELMLSVMSNLAAVFMAMEKYQEAVYVCSDAVSFAERASQPVDAKIYFRRGSAAMQLHCYEDAVTDLTEASALCPQDKAIAAKLKDARRLTDAKRKREMKVYSRMFT